MGEFNAFVDIVPVPVADNAQLMSNFNAFSMGGGGSLGLKADSQGMWFGAVKFVDAPFKVDMAGNVTATSISLVGGTIKYGKTAFSDTTHAGYYIGNEGVYFGSASDAKKIKYTIATGAFELTGVSLSWSDVAGAGKPQDNATVGATAGTNLKNSLGSLIGDNDVLNQAIANGSFTGGTFISGTTIYSPTISAGTITGATVRTASSGQRVVMDSNNYISLYSSHAGGTLAGIVYGINFGGIGQGIALDGTNLVGILVGGTTIAYANSGGLSMSGGYPFYSYDILPISSGSYSLGNSSYMYALVYASQWRITSSNYCYFDSSSRFNFNATIITSGDLVANGSLVAGSSGYVVCRGSYFYPQSITYKDGSGVNQTKTFLVA